MNAVPKIAPTNTVSGNADIWMLKQTNNFNTGLPFDLIWLPYKCLGQKCILNSHIAIVSLYCWYKYNKNNILSECSLLEPLYRLKGDHLSFVDV